MDVGSSTSDIDQDYNMWSNVGTNVFVIVLDENTSKLYRASSNVVEH